MQRNKQFTTEAVALKSAALGQRLRQARKAQGLTLADLEQNTRIHRNTLARVEKGDLGTSIGVLFSVLESLGELSDIEHVVAQPEVPRHKRLKSNLVLDNDF